MTTPSVGMQALSGEELRTRDTYPEEYPCFLMSGYYRPTEGCLEKCCAGRTALDEGAGEDAHHAQLAMEAGLEASNRQPDFGDDDERTRWRHRSRTTRRRSPARRRRAPSLTCIATTRRRAATRDALWLFGSLVSLGGGRSRPSSSTSRPLCHPVK